VRRRGIAVRGVGVLPPVAGPGCDAPVLVRGARSVRVGGPRVATGAPSAGRGGLAARRGGDHRGSSREGPRPLVPLGPRRVPPVLAPAGGVHPHHPDRRAARAVTRRRRGVRRPRPSEAVFRWTGPWCEGRLRGYDTSGDL